VLKFAGDAIIVCWPLVEGESGATAARAAAACALALVSLKDASNVTGALALSLHIGLHAGALSEMIVGDGDMDGGRWEHVCVGEPLAAMAPLVAAAASGEVRASDAVWALLQGAAVAGDAVCAGGRTLLAMADGAAPPLLAATTSGGGAADGGEDAALELAAATSYLAPGLVAALAGGGHTFGAATLRRVTVLFILLPPCGADDFSLLSALVREIHTVVGECGGTTQQSLCDDKGTVSIGIWGKPGAGGADTFANSSERALAAAKHLGGSLRRIAAAHGRADPIACGVCKGRAFVGNVGSPSRCEWAVVGVRNITQRLACFAAARLLAHPPPARSTQDVMNTAARLMVAALALGLPSLCCAPTAQTVRAAMEEAGISEPMWLRCAPMQMSLKGTAAPVPVYGPGGGTPRTSECEARSSSAAAQRRASRADSRMRRSKGMHSRGSSSFLEALSTAHDDAEGGWREQEEEEEAEQSWWEHDSAGITMRRRSTSVSAPLFGRAPELARVAALMLAAEAESAALVVVIAGGTSCGKSALLRGVAADAAACGRMTFALAPPGSCGGGVAAAAFATPWVAAAVKAHLGSLSRALRPLAPLLAELLPYDARERLTLATHDSAAALAALDEAGREAAVCALAVALLAPVLCGARRAVLLVDDAPFMDALSAALLGALLATHRPALVLTMGRSELEDPASSGSGLVASLTERAAARVRTCVIGPLCADALGELCASELSHVVGGAPLGVGALPPGLVSAVSLLSGGHPLLLKEALALLLREEHIVVEGAAVRLRCDLARLPELVARGLKSEEGISRLEVFIQRRVDSLGPGARACVMAAAVLGGEFDAPLLSRCVGPRFSFGAVCAAAAEISHEGMWTAVLSGGSGPRYAFASEVLRSLIFTATPKDQLAELHASVLRCLEEASHMLSGGNNATDDYAVGDGCFEARSPRQQQSAAVWADWARLARGANQRGRAGAFFLAAARIHAASGTACGLDDAAHTAREGLRSLAASHLAAAASDDAANAGAVTDAVNVAGHHDDEGGGLEAQPLLGPRRPRRRSSPRRYSLQSARCCAANVASSGDHALLRAQLDAILEMVAHVQSSWSLLQPDVHTHATTITTAFAARFPEALRTVRGKDGLLLCEPAMAAVMHHHGVTALTLIGTCVAGGHDFDALAIMLIQTGKMHARFGPCVREHLHHYIAIMLQTAQEALGAEFTAEREAAWLAACAFVQEHFLRGLDRAEADTVAEVALRGELHGMLVAAH
jgi:hypothetical protein